MQPDILKRRETHFLLWRPGIVVPPPALCIGALGVPAERFTTIPLHSSPQIPDIWEVAVSDCALTPNTVYRYWFQVTCTDVYSNSPGLLYCTDPFATSVDYSFCAGVPQGGVGSASMDPAALILYVQDDKGNGKLVPSDSDGKPVVWENDPLPSQRPANDNLVIYELPTRWSHTDQIGNMQQGTGTFQDIRALIEVDAQSPTFPTEPAFGNRAHLQELGVNALELLPPEDSHTDPLGWHYGTSHFFAADYSLSFRNPTTPPRPSQALAHLIQSCHQQGIRFFLDVVMAFCKNIPYRDINFLDFLIQHGTRDPEEIGREGFGGDLLRYKRAMKGYDPLSGQQVQAVYPSRALMKAHIWHWLNYYRIDGIRMDSVNNIACPEFLQEFKDYARGVWRERGGHDDRFLVVGEELSVPLSLVKEHRLDGLWNEHFKQITRQVILGKPMGQDTFEQSVHKMIDCRNLGFTDGGQAVNYLTSHDVGGIGNERIVTWLWNNGVLQAEERLMLAFVCLLTAVGIPMILAGDEFGNEQHLKLDDTDEGRRNKQIDPVNWSSLSRDPWRMRLFQYVSQLVHFRTRSRALRSNDTHFIHSDFTGGKRVLAWQRGDWARDEELVVVVANFSDWKTPHPDDPKSEYRVSHWPPTPAGKTWREITQKRVVPAEWVGREPLYSWEAKVYVLN